MKEKIIAISFILSLTITLVSAQEGYIIEEGPDEYNSVIYNWGSSDSNSYYQDALAGNPDLGVMVCDAEQDNPYLGLVSLMNQDDDPEWFLMSYSSQTDNLPEANIDESFRGDSCARTSISSFFISPSVFEGNSPPTRVAAHPTDNYLIVSDNPSGSGGQFVDANSQLSGSYSGNMDYTFASNDIQMDLSSINVDSDIGTRSYDLNEPGRGISDDRPLIAGVCNDDEGAQCLTGVDTFTNPTDIPVTYGFDVQQSDVNDQNVYTRWGVANGIEFEELDIGADSRVTDLTIEQDPIFFSQTQEVEFEISNIGNVPITTSFDVEATIEGPSDSDLTDSETVFEETFTISEGLPENGGSTTRSFEWLAEDFSGDYTVRIESDINNDLNEIVEGDLESDTFELKPITLPDVFVDGELKEREDTEFESAGEPYNLSLVMRNSDEVRLPDANVRIIEEDGTSSFAPTQGWNASEDGEFEKLGVTSEAEINVDDEGEASVTMIPTGNVLLKEEYNETELNDLIDYNMYLEGEEEDGTEFTFVIDEETTDQYPLEVDNPEDIQGTSENKSLPNLESYTKAAMNQVYSIFANFWGTVV